MPLPTRELAGIGGGFVLGYLVRERIVKDLSLRSDLRKLELVQSQSPEGLAVELISKRFSSKVSEVAVCGLLSITSGLLFLSGQFPPSISLACSAVFLGWATAIYTDILHGSDILAVEAIKKFPEKITLDSLERKLKVELFRQYPGESEKVDRLLSLWKESVQAKLNK